MINKDIIMEAGLVNVKKGHDSMTWAKLLEKGNIACGLDEQFSILIEKLKGLFP